MNGFVQYSLPGQTLQSTILSTAETSAKTYAKNFASYNTAGGVSSLTLKDADIEFGFTDASNKYTPAPTYTGYPNTVKVTMRLDSSDNGSLKLFFAPIFGLTSSNVQSTAAATIYTANITNFTPGYGAGILPMTLDVNAWNSYLQTGLSSDGTTHAAANGVRQMQIYPSPNIAPGNFGMLSLNDSSNASSDISNWITNGLSSTDLANLDNAGLLPLQSPNPGLWIGRALRDSSRRTSTRCRSIRHFSWRSSSRSSAHPVPRMKPRRVRSTRRPTSPQVMLMSATAASARTLTTTL